MGLAARVRVKQVVPLSSAWGKLSRVVLDYLRNDGTWQEQVREVYDKGDGATILLYNRARRTVILTRQFRYPAFVKGHDALLLETPAGLLDGHAPEDCIRAEAEQETGFRVARPEKLFHCFMTPGAVTEIVHFFAAEYHAEDRVGEGGGLAHEGEDIEVVELPFERAFAMIADGRLADGKTIMLLQHAALHIFA